MWHHQSRCPPAPLPFVLQALQATITALGKKNASQAAAAAFGRILDAFVRRASGWPEVASVLDSVPMFKVGLLGGHISRKHAWGTAGPAATAEGS